MTDTWTWNDLSRELDAWNAEGRVATLWWRDDDAVAVTPALQQLISTAREFQVSAALAVIPANAEASLADLTDPIPEISILQHGLAHTNHAPAGEKKAELGPHRPTSEIMRDLETGARLLTARFAAPLPVLVPPWNRISRTVTEALPDIGLVGLSTFQPRTAASNGITVVNTHADIIDWRNTRGFAGVTHVLGQFCTHLQARRLGTVDGAEATGLLTHHLVHTPECWQFLVELFRLTTEHPAAQWLCTRDLFNDNATG